jgi:hypothetical protein
MFPIICAHVHRTHNQNHMRRKGYALTVCDVVFPRHRRNSDSQPALLWVRVPGTGEEICLQDTHGRLVPTRICDSRMSAVRGWIAKDVLAKLKGRVLSLSVWSGIA